MRCTRELSPYFVAALLASCFESRVRERWVWADDVNRVKFSGLTTTSVNSTLTCETVDGESRCTTTDPGYTWAAPIHNVTWGKLA